MREYQLAHGSDKAGAYQTVLQVMAALLIVGFAANMLVRPVAEKYWLPEENRNLQPRDHQTGTSREIQGQGSR
jgi:ABC-type nickel/cobalt efflux system permease component RcnA